MFGIDNNVELFSVRGFGGGGGAGIEHYGEVKNGKDTLISA